MEKIFNKQGELSKKLDSKTGKFSIEMPDFYKDKNGNYVILDEPIIINSLHGFNEYIKKHQEIVEFLGENYPKLVSTVYKNTLTILADPLSRSSYSKILSGKPVNNAFIYKTATASDVNSVFRGFLKTYNAKNMGLEGKEVVLPKVSRTPKQFLSLLKKGRDGYMIPEIDKNGLVVNATSSKDDLGIKLLPFDIEDVSYEQLVEYFTAPFGDKAKESDVNLYKVLELCQEAYKSIGSEEMGKKTQELVDYCISVYPLSFARIKDDRVPTEEVPPTIEEDPPVSEEDPPVSEEDPPVSEEDPPVAPVVEYEERNKLVLVKVPLSGFKDFYGNYADTTGFLSLGVEKVLVEKERES